MEVAYTVAQLEEYVAKYRTENKRIGLVPTMGYLHDGHLSLINLCKDQADLVILSIFVNPIQFGPNEDLDAYPRNLEKDLRLCEERGVDLVFCPKPSDMYVTHHSTYVIEDEASLGLCGKSRPGHFKGVLTVCCKLFNLTRCEVAVFGQKDAQQVTLIEKMVRELNMPVKIVRGQTERNVDGLAMSSRNAYLTENERRIAPTLQKALQRGRTLIVDEGVNDVATVLRQMKAVIEVFPELRLDYLEIVDRQTLKNVEIAQIGKLLIVGAVYIGKTRLIDNLEV
jgi:pantoate--beta-alanine ligase